MLSPINTEDALWLTFSPSPWWIKHKREKQKSVWRENLNCELLKLEWGRKIKKDDCYKAKNMGKKWRKSSELQKNWVFNVLACYLCPIYYNSIKLYFWTSCFNNFLYRNSVFGPSHSTISKPCPTLMATHLELVLPRTFCQILGYVDRLSLYPVLMSILSHILF